MSSTIRIAAGFALGASALSMAIPAMAQAPMSQGEIETLPPEYQTGPVRVTPAPMVNDGEERIIGADGVETIVRTRRIEGRALVGSSYQQGGYPQSGYAYAPAYAPASTVMEREQWIDECESRTSGRSEKEKGQIIGGLFGAVAGGLLGNRIAGSGSRLGGTLIGAGAGGLGGALLGGLIGGGKRDGRYDCAAALDGYLAQYGESGPRVGTRYIPAPTYGYSYPAYAQPVQYGYAQGCACNTAQAQQVVYVPYEYAQRQRVIVRETVREETYEVPGATRVIDLAPMPSPKMIKQPTRVAPSPKMIKQ